MCLYKFDHNLPIGSGDSVQTKSYADADADRILTHVHLRLGGGGGGGVGGHNQLSHRKPTNGNIPPPFMRFNVSNVIAENLNKKVV